MIRIRVTLVAVCFAVLSLSGPTQAQEEAASFADSLKSGTPKVSLRYRFESVSDDAAAKDAAASTLRTTLSYRTEKYKKFSLFAEAENVARAEHRRAIGLTCRQARSHPAT